jgi:uncharacterized protein involved in exopolysaccharide biosynthesis
MPASDEDLEEGRGSGSDGSPVDYRRLLRAAWAGRIAILVAGVIGAALGQWVASSSWGDAYVTGASVHYVGLPNTRYADGQRELPSLGAMVSSDQFMSRLRDDLGLDGVPLRAMRNVVRSTVDPRTGIISFEATGGTPEDAADLANGTIRLFMEEVRARRSEQLRNERDSLAERVQAAQREASRAQEAFQRFQVAAGVEGGFGESTDVVAVAGMRTQANLAEAEVQALEAQVRQLRAAVAEMSEGAGEVQARRPGGRRLNELRQRLRELRGQGRGDSHPQVQALRREVEVLASEEPVEVVASAPRSSLYETTAARLATAETELEAARNRQASLAAFAAREAERSARLTEVEAEAAGLLADVNVKTELLSQLTTQAAEIDDLLRDVPAGFRVVSEALEPEAAVTSKKKKIMPLLIPAAAIFLVLLIYTGRELWGLRVQSPQEVAWWGGGPVLGATAWPRRPAAMFDLLADLGELMKDAQGNLLVVSASVEERMAAQRIVYELNEVDVDTVLLESPEALRLVGTYPPPALAADNPTPASRRKRKNGRGRKKRQVAKRDDSGKPPVERVEDPPPTVIPFREEGPGAPGLRIEFYDEASPFSVRSAARRADGVLVVVRAGISCIDLRSLRNRIGNDNPVAFLLLDIEDDHVWDDDRVGSLDEFLRAFAA